jgi:hypothetical protein
MTHDPAKLKLANDRLLELLNIELRRDLSERQKLELIAAKMQEYRQQARGEQLQQPTAATPTRRSLEEQVEVCRKAFEKGIREGRIHMTGFPE